MKKKLLVLSIISVVLAVLGAVLGFLTFKPNFAQALKGTFKGMFGLSALIKAGDWIGVAFGIIGIVLLVLAIVFWVLNLVRLIITKSKGYIAVDILGLIGSVIGGFAIIALLVTDGFGFYEFKNFINGTTSLYIHSFIFSVFCKQDGRIFSPLFQAKDYVFFILGVLSIVAAIVAYVFGLKSLIVSRKVMEGKVKENGAKEEAEEAAADTAKEGEGAPSSEDELRGAENAELNDQEEGKGVGPYVVQYFNYGPAPKAAPEEKPEEAAEDEEMLTSDDLRKIIREEMHIDPNAPKASSADADQIREIVKEEIAKALQGYTANNKPQDNSLTTEQVRTVVSQELDKRHYVAEEPKKEEVKPQPKPEPAPAPIVVQVVAAPAPAPTPAPAPAPVVEEEKKKVIRVPFPERLDAAEKDVKANYNDIKAEALSFGLKSRLSNSGDTFRLHTKTYLKITVAGKGLKLYYALDPKAYENSPIPLKDVSNKNIYKEIPGCFKVKSDLSVKRAKQLIADACEKDNLEQGKPEIKNYAAEMKDYKPQSGDDDGGDDDDDDK